MNRLNLWPPDNVLVEKYLSEIVCMVMVSITLIIHFNCFSCRQCLVYIVRVSLSRWTSSWMWTFRSTLLISVKCYIFLWSKHSKSANGVNRHLFNMFSSFLFTLSILVRWQVQTGYCQHVVRRWDARWWRVQSPRWPTIPVKHFFHLFHVKMCELSSNVIMVDIGY